MEPLKGALLLEIAKEDESADACADINDDVKEDAKDRTCKSKKLKTKFSISEM